MHEYNTQMSIKSDNLQGIKYFEMLQKKESHILNKKYCMQIHVRAFDTKYCYYYPMILSYNFILAVFTILVTVSSILLQVFIISDDLLECWIVIYVNLE